MNTLKSVRVRIKMPIVARDLQLCIGLLDIVLEKDNLQLEFSEMKTMRRDDGMYEW